MLKLKMSNHDGRSSHLCSSRQSVSVSALCQMVNWLYKLTKCSKTFADLFACFRHLSRFSTTVRRFGETVRANMYSCNQRPAIRVRFLQMAHKKPLFEHLQRNELFLCAFLICLFISLFCCCHFFCLSAEHSCLGPAMQKGPIWLRL